MREVDYKSKPIDPDFLQKPDEYPVTGEHKGHKVYAEGKQRYDAEGNPYPTKLGIHGTVVAVDFDGCVADGVCHDVCPVNVFEWFLNEGQSGSGNDKWPLEGEEWERCRTDKADPVRENDCIFCMACETSCPVSVIKINPP